MSNEERWQVHVWGSCSKNSGWHHWRHAAFHSAFNGSEAWNMSFEDACQYALTLHDGGMIVRVYDIETDSSIPASLL